MRWRTGWVARCASPLVCRASHIEPSAVRSVSELWVPLEWAAEICGKNNSLCFTPGGPASVA